MVLSIENEIGEGGCMRKALMILMVCMLLFSPNGSVVAQNDDTDDYAHIVVKLQPLNAPVYSASEESNVPEHFPVDYSMKNDIVYMPSNTTQESNQPITSSQDPNPEIEGNGVTTLQWQPSDSSFRSTSSQIMGTDFVWSDLGSWFDSMKGIDFSSSFQGIRMQFENEYQQIMNEGLTRYQNRSIEFDAYYRNLSANLGIREEWERLSQYVDLKLQQSKMRLDTWEQQWRMMSQEMNIFFENVRREMGRTF